MLKLLITDGFSLFNTQSTCFKGKNTACPEQLSAYKQMETKTELFV